jgi:hypothetical protein
LTVFTIIFILVAVVVAVVVVAAAAAVVVVVEEEAYYQGQQQYLFLRCSRNYWLQSNFHDYPVDPDPNRSILLLVDVVLPLEMRRHACESMSH